VGVEQLKKVPGYLKTFREGKKILDAAIADCNWIDERKMIAGSVVAPYFWSALFHGERAKVDYGVFKAAMRQVKGGYGFGFTQRPGYMYDIFRNPNAYGNKGCPYNCHLYSPGKIEWKAGMCPVSEDVIPRIINTNNMQHDLKKLKIQAKLMKEAIKLAESGNVKPLEYSDLEKKVLQTVKAGGQLEPMEVIAIFDKKGWGHFDEHSMFSIMEDLRERFPYKLSHAGPRKFSYHELK
jgi:hypothetical protein